MKKMKKMMALVIAVVMMMAMSMTTMAEDTYSITIKKPVVGQTYSAYKLFDVTYDDAKSNYSYTITNNTEAGVTDWYDILTTNSDLMIYFEFKQIGDSNIYNVISKVTNANVKDLAKELNAISNKPGYAGEVKADTTDATITLTSAGYYFVDSTLGALCSLDTAKPTVEIQEKNAQPTINKFVQEDSKKGDASWGTTATAEVGQVVNYKLTVNVGTTEFAANLGTGVDNNFVIVDTLPEGVNLNSTTVNNQTSYNVAIDQWTKGEHYDVAFDDSSRKITVILYSTKLQTLPENSNIEILYDVTVNSEIVTDGNDNDNINKAILSYGTYTTEPAQAQLKSYSVDVYKYTTTTSEGNEIESPLQNAKFKLYKMDGTAKKYATVDQGKITGWDNSGTELTTPDNGEINFAGLDIDDEYYLEETAAPDGYNKLTGDIKFKIVPTDTGWKVNYQMPDANNFSDADPTLGIKVLNQSGSLLPETGGIGTTIFYTAGALLVIAGVVVLVTRKRMENQ